MQQSRMLLAALTVVSATAAGSAFANVSQSKAAQRAQANAKITMKQARTMALKSAPGKVVDEEFEKEDGAWRYSFDIRGTDGIHEIGISAKTGHIVENSFEGKQDRD